MKINNIVKANSVLVSLMIIITLLTFMLFNGDLLNNKESLIQNEYHGYLNSKFHLIDEINKSHKELSIMCLEEEKEMIFIDLGHIKYNFHCEFINIFIDKPPTKKHVYFKNIDTYLNMKLFEDRIKKIDSLSDLPSSSLNNPQIVILTKAISDKLDKDFYGIIITNHIFELKYGAKFYGVLYSSYSNESSRYITYQSNIIENIKNNYSYWQYLPRSKNILRHEKNN